MESEGDAAQTAFDHLHYVPCLRWKQGEYQAVSRLSASAKATITPLIEVPEIGYDFESRAPQRTVDDHLTLFVKRIKPKWGKRVCFIDCGLLDANERMANGRHPVKYVFDDLRRQGCRAVPVTGVDRDAPYKDAVAEAASHDGRGACLRLTVEQITRSRIKAQIDDCLSAMSICQKSCDLIVDLGAPIFEPIQGLARAIMMLLQKVPYRSRWRTFTLLATSFPSTMAGIDKGDTIIPRSEWILYKLIRSFSVEAGLRLPTFGDYAISHPDLLQMDPRLVKPSATIRYTIDDAWLVVKGANVRDYKFEQYRTLSRSVMNSPHFTGIGFSAGDRYIAACADGSGSTGSLTSWREVGTNHHIERVVRDIASLYGSSGTL